MNPTGLEPGLAGLLCLGAQGACFFASPASRGSCLFRRTSLIPPYMSVNQESCKCLLFSFANGNKQKPEGHGLVFEKAIPPPTEMAAFSQICLFIDVRVCGLTHKHFE